MSEDNTPWWSSGSPLYDGMGMLKGAALAGAGTAWVRFLQNVPQTSNILKVTDVPSVTAFGRTWTQPAVEVVTTTDSVAVNVRSSLEKTKLTKAQRAVAWGNTGLKVVKVAGAASEAVVGGAILGGRTLKLIGGDVSQFGNLALGYKLGEFSLAPKPINVSKQYAVGKSPGTKGKKVNLVRSDKAKLAAGGRMGPNPVGFEDVFDRAYVLDKKTGKYKLIPNRGRANKKLRQKILDVADYNFQLGRKANPFVGDVVSGKGTKKVKLVPSAYTDVPSLFEAKQSVKGYKPRKTVARRGVFLKDNVIGGRARFKGPSGGVSQAVSGLATDYAGTELGLFALESDLVKGGITILPGVTDASTDKYVEEYVNAYKQQGLLKSSLQAPGLALDSIRNLRETNVSERGQTEVKSWDNPWTIAKSDALFVQEQVSEEYGDIAGVTAGVITGAGSLVAEGTDQIIDEVVPDVDTEVLTDIGYVAEAKGKDDVADVLLLEERMAQWQAQAQANYGGWTSGNSSELVKTWCMGPNGYYETVKTRTQRDNDPNCW